MDQYLINFHKTTVKNSIEIAKMNLQNACDCQEELLRLTKSESYLVEDLDLQRKAMNQINQDLKSLSDCL